MNSQVQNALPVLSEFGLKATFFVNPGAGHYAQNRVIWEKKLVEMGHEVANHTWSHKGAETAAVADEEISKCAEVIRRVYGGKERLGTFATPGGVPWKPSEQELAKIFNKNFLIPTSNRQMSMDTMGDGDTRRVAQMAVSGKKWVELCLHGVGGEWLSTSVPHLRDLCEFLKKNAAEIWTAPTVNVSKYQIERDGIETLSIVKGVKGSYRLTLNCSKSIAVSFGSSVEKLFDEPLTVQVDMPAGWKSAKAVQSGKTLPMIATTVGGKRVLLIDVVPNTGLVNLYSYVGDQN